MTKVSDNIKNKKKVKILMDDIANADSHSLKEKLSTTYHENAEWRGSHPMNEIKGVAAIEEVVWGPLLNAFPDLERRDNIIIGGNYEGRDYVGMVGHLAGTFKQDWQGIPATGGLIYIRYGEFHQLVDGKIVQSTSLMDVLNVIKQAGFWPLAPSLGSEEMWPGPISADGVLFSEQDPDESAASLALTLAMHKSLDNTIVERDELLNMSQKQYWHPKMMWYGPCGVGANRGLEGFVDYHQRPFRIAFPERNSGKNHYVRIGDGKYSATSGWPSVVAEHVGSNWLGLAGTNKQIEMRVMDFYLADEGLIRENWVPIDVMHILLQLDVDILARVRQQFRKPSIFE